MEQFSIFFSILISEKKKMAGIKTKYNPDFYRKTQFCNRRIVSSANNNF